MKFFSIIMLALTGFFSQVGITHNDFLKASLEPVEIAGEFLSSFTSDNSKHPRQESIKTPSDFIPTFFALFNEVEWEEEEENREDSETDHPTQHAEKFHFSFPHLPTSAILTDFPQALQREIAVPLFILFEVYRL